MSGAKITIVGNIGKDAPELRFTGTGVPVCVFSVADTPRILDKNKQEWVDGETTWYRVNCWRDLAQNVAEGLAAGTRVIVTGSVRNRKYQDKEGNDRFSLEIEADAVGPDLKWRTVKVLDGVHEGAKKGGQRGPTEDPFESASTSRPAAQQQAQAQPAAASSGDW
ncbi:MAG TPA: single-stranded DNA-binding protein [Kofleriaceae bacterium]